MFINPISDKLTDFCFKPLHCLVKLGIRIIFKKPQYVLAPLFPDRGCILS
ncbi:Uncharacterised protein [Escherichia coli]|nr:Uncharacterised protein [Escherichia coli]